MKNFQLILVLSALTPGSMAFGAGNIPHNHEIDAQELSSPTDHVLKRLALSKTLVRSSQDWKETIHKDGAIARTALAQTHIMDYPGWAAFFYNLSHKINLYHLMENAVSGRFAIEKITEGPIKISSSITASSVIKAHDEKEAESLRKTATEKKSESLSLGDDYTYCERTFSRKFNKKTASLEIHMNEECKTIMQYDRYKAYMDRSDR